MFPWESALTGYEVCPEEIYGKHEIHISGDITFAVKQYFLATGDLDWLKKYGSQLAIDTAKFWASRVTYNKTKDAYVIYDVMPPDEYKDAVNNSVYTNVVAKINLQFAVEVANLFQIETPREWEEIIEKLYIPYDVKLQYHPEYEGFEINKPGVVVKQADTILINYPLQYPMTDAAKNNDLNFYSNITDPNGPAMTHSMFSIGWLEVGNKVAAQKEFKKNYANIQEPFKVWTEIRNGKGATNFITAAGGFLQSVIFGYGGFRLKQDGLHFNLQSPPDSDGMILNGVKFMGSSIEFGTSLRSSYIKILKYGRKLLFLKHNGKLIRLYEQIPRFVNQGIIVTL